jgi:hypothetical protein
VCCTKTGDGSEIPLLLIGSTGAIGRLDLNLAKILVRFADAAGICVYAPASLAARGSRLQNLKRKHNE